METCKSPPQVMVAAYELARQFMPDYSFRFSGNDAPKSFQRSIVYKGVGAHRLSIRERHRMADRIHMRLSVPAE